MVQPITHPGYVVQPIAPWYKLIQHVTTQNNMRLSQEQENMLQLRDAANTRCMRLLPAEHSILLYSEPFVCV